MLATLGSVAGCGTTRWSDTSRTATEQMLLSTAIDRAISDIDFSPLAGKDVFLEDQYLKGTVDSPYIIATLRQQLLASGCLLKADRKEATYIVEARAGGVGTNRHDVMLGVPAFNVPSSLPATSGGLSQFPSSVPEIPFAKSTNQKGLAKIAVFAYHQESGLAVWQSGAFPVVTNANDSWLLGMGPVQRGTIYGTTKFAGSKLLFSDGEDKLLVPRVPVTAEAVFASREPQGSADKAVPAKAEAAVATSDVSTDMPSAAKPATAPPRVIRASVSEEDRGAVQQASFNVFRPRTWFGKPDKPKQD